MDHFLIHSSVYGQISDLHFLTIVDSAAMNLGVQIQFLLIEYLRCVAIHFISVALKSTLTRINTEGEKFYLTSQFCTYFEEVKVET